MSKHWRSSWCGSWLLQFTNKAKITFITKKVSWHNLTYAKQDWNGLGKINLDPIKRSSNPQKKQINKDKIKDNLDLTSGLKKKKKNLLQFMS